METKNLEEVYNEFGKYVVQQGRTNLTKKKAPQNYTGSLYNSLKYEILKKSDGKVIGFFMDSYGMFQDAGVFGANPSLINSENKKGKQKGKSVKSVFLKPMGDYSRFSYKSKKPPLSPLIKWAKYRKIRFRDKASGRFKKGNYEAIGYYLQKSIYAQGISPTLWFSTPFRRALLRLPKDIEKAFSKDVLNFLKQK